MGEQAAANIAAVLDREPAFEHMASTVGWELVGDEVCWAGAILTLFPDVEFEGAGEEGRGEEGEAGEEGG